MPKTKNKSKIFSFLQSVERTKEKRWYKLIREKEKKLIKFTENSSVNKGRRTLWKYCKIKEENAWTKYQRVNFKQLLHSCQD